MRMGFLKEGKLIGWRVLANGEEEAIGRLLRQGQVLVKLTATSAAEATAAAKEATFSFNWTVYFLGVSVFLVAGLVIGGVVLRLTRRSSYFPYLGGLVVVLAVLLTTPYGVWLTQQETRLATKASLEKEPRNIKLLEVSKDGFVLSWQTEEAVIGAIRVKEEGGEATKTFIDEKGVVATKLHRVKAEGLKSKTVYEVEILSGGEVYTDGGKPLLIKTLP